jgi:hypothetical protein
MILSVRLFKYIDDPTIYSKNRQDHFDHIRKVFLHRRKCEMSLNPTKYIFGVRQGKLVGHIISASEIIIDPMRVIAIQNP